jgi:hypothetical protein
MSSSSTSLWYSQTAIITLAYTKVVLFENAAALRSIQDGSRRKRRNANRGRDVIVDI